MDAFLAVELMELPGGAIVNYVFPNNMHVAWSIMIVIYPYITGLIAGAFVVSAMSHVFGVEELKPIANFSLIAAFCFGLFAGLPLLIHLGQPQRAYQIYTTPHLTSAMSIFGYAYSSYMVLLMIEIWVIFRHHFIEMYHKTQGKGLMGFIWYVLTLGVTEYNPEAEKFDRKLALILAGLGIPWACALHGYVGFVFGSVKAVAWWATALQPFIFLSSAIVSGMAVLFLMYIFVIWRARCEYDYALVKRFMISLWMAFILDYALEVLELTFLAYERGHHWEVVRPLLLGPLWNSYVLGQMGILSFGPLAVLGIVALFKLPNKLMVYLSCLGSLMLVFQVLVMRYNVVIGGQLISKSERGYVDFHWELFGKESVLTALIIFSGPFIAYYVIQKFLPIFAKQDLRPKA